MKMKFGAIVVDGRGKIGGHVASKNRGGAYLRTKVTPTNPNSSAQAQVRNRLTSLSQGFRALLAAQILAWNNAVSDFAKTDIFGDIKQPSGINLFVKLNSNLLEIGQSTISNPPLPSSVEPVLTVIGTAISGNQSFEASFSPDPVPADTSFIVRATAQMSPGKQASKSDFRNIKVLAAATISPDNIANAYINKFGALVAGRKISIELIPVNNLTGQKGQAVSSTIVVG